jgi:hypothetical protein
MDGREIGHLCGSSKSEVEAEASKWVDDDAVLATAAALAALRLQGN